MGFWGKLTRQKTTTSSLPRYQWENVAHVNFSEDQLAKLQDIRENMAGNMLKIQAIEDIENTGFHVADSVKNLLGSDFSISSQQRDVSSIAKTMLKNQLADIKAQYVELFQSVEVSEDSAKQFLESDLQHITEMNRPIRWQTLISDERSR